MAHKFCQSLLSFNFITLFVTGNRCEGKCRYLQDANGNSPKGPNEK